MADVIPVFGPMVIGVVLNMMLYGAVCTQMFTYFRRYPNDLLWIRYLMVYLFVVETAVVVVELGIVYQPLILEFGSVHALIFYPKLLPGDSLLIALVSTPIQLFTAWRMKVITSSYILPGLIVLLSIASFVFFTGGGIFVSTLVFINSQFRDFAKFTAEAIVWLTCSAACDILIAGGMTYTLLTRRTGYSTVDRQIDRIVRLTMQTGMVTAAAALADVVLFVALPHTGANFLLDFPLSSLYTLSILAMLNSREPKKGFKDSEQGVSGTRSTPQMLSSTIVNPPSSIYSSQLQHSRHKSQPSSSTANSIKKSDIHVRTETVVEFGPPLPIVRDRYRDNDDSDISLVTSPQTPPYRKSSISASTDRTRSLNSQGNEGKTVRNGSIQASAATGDPARTLRHARSFPAQPLPGRAWGPRPTPAQLRARSSSRGRSATESLVAPAAARI